MQGCFYYQVEALELALGISLCLAASLDPKAQFERVKNSYIG
jgi:hypothetical protein